MVTNRRQIRGEAYLGPALVPLAGRTSLLGKAEARVGERACVRRRAGSRTPLVDAPVIDAQRLAVLFECVGGYADGPPRLDRGELARLDPLPDGHERRATHLDEIVDCVEAL